MRFWVAVLLAALPAAAEDWPEWRGKGRVGVWSETGLLERFPASGLRVVWKAAIGSGYAGPAVAAGRVFVPDFQDGRERALCFDEVSGRLLWNRSWEADYRGLDYPSGPRATPTVDGDRVYVLGATGHLACLRVADGAVVWRKHFPSDYGADIPIWGTSNAPVVDGDRLIAVVSGKPDAKVVAFDKHTGREIWRALSPAGSEPGYSQPVIITHEGRRQVIVWHAGGVASLDPERGAVYWEQPFKIHMNTPIATPVFAAPHLFVSAFFNGARLYRLGQRDAELLWRGTADREQNNDTLHALMASAIIDGGHIYGFCSYGQLRCLRLSDGERVWESQEATVERMRNVSAFLVKQGSRVWISNDRGELIIARLSPAGYAEISRTKLIEPDSRASGRREFKAVHWSHPAYANRHAVVRNDSEIRRVSLAAEP